MKEINWNIFKSKFNGKETSSFENLAYQLFCAEHNNRIGIFRFKNQTGIETEPIQVENELIGFQAKFYDTKISGNKDDIIDSIKKAKRENADLNKILFYLNQEFSESTKKEKKDPDYKTDIEAEAAKINLNIEWRVPSHFERQLALPENKYLADFFFDNGKNVIDFIEGLKKHTENIFLSIQTDILFKEQIIKIDRSSALQELINCQNNPTAIILSGEGGCGKTAIIKEFYNKNESAIPFYVFKAAEFNIQEIKSLFKNYGDYSLNEFISAHEKEPQKTVVIDSAERISDLEYQEPFKEFLTELIKNSWTIIFTTRLSYLDDLRFQFLSVFRLPFEHININNLSLDELKVLANQQTFELPSNDKMKSIICNPFYLDEYLRNYDSYGSSVQYRQFKNIIWLRKIQNSSFTKNNTHILREKCFLNIVKIRSEQGAFYVIPANCSEDILSLLQKDDIIGYDTNSGGYFITHDIYEEWGLDIIIERTFNSAKEYGTFLNEIGTSLIVRRAFRQWLSDKLFDSIENIKPFIEEIFDNINVELFWKDEILTSILLSDYSEEFFNRFKEKIIENEFLVLIKIIFLLRISCKAVDDSISKILNNSADVNLSYVFTKPKGFGWNSTINFIFEKIDLLPVSVLSFILPLLSDWCNNNKRGETTKKTGLLALKFYRDIQNNENYRYRSNFEDQLIKIIIHSSNEIKDELSKIFDEVITNQEVDNQTPYYDLCKAIISSDLENISISIALPEYVLKIAELFWIDSNKKKESYGGHGVEKYYGLNEYGHHSYFPASAFQTPIYWLLQFSFIKTVDFIIDFTNRTVKNYADSGFDQNVEEIELTLLDNKVHKQYFSQGLWNIYRGYSSPVSPYLLQSMHMALEKHLLEIADKQEPKIVESWLIYLIEKSNSASLTSVVTSIVLAHPNKFYNVSKILFSSSSLMLYDNLRARMGEHQAKNIYSIGRGFDNKTKRFEDERLKTCEDKHRSHSLESLILNYQFFRDEKTSEEEAELRKKEIWTIIDSLYSDLPEKTKETDNDKTKRLLLARIDRRKMNPKVESQGDNLIINFNPQIDEDLEVHSNEVAKESNEMMKYTALKMWSTFKFEKSKKYGDYEQYENNPQLVLKETKEIIEGLTIGQDGIFQLFNSSTPPYACSALIRDYSSKLTVEELNFCKQTILKYAVAPFQQDYQYQISDGVEVSINALPFLIKLFPDDNEELLGILLFVLFDTQSIGQYKRVCDYSIESILNTLWHVSSEDAQKVFFGFLKFKQVFNHVKNEIIEASLKKHGRPYYSQSDIMEKLLKDYGNDIEKFISSPLQIEELDTSKYSLEDLEIAFQLVPHDTTNKSLIEFVSKILPVFAEALLQADKKIDYSLRHRIFKRFAYFILFRESKEVHKHIQPFVENFTTSEEMASLLEEIIGAQDRVVRYEQFWIIWESFYEKIQSVLSFKSYHSSKVVHNYLLAWNWWNETANSWHSLKEREKVFYRKAVNDIGHHPSVLDSVAKLLNEIGSGFLNEGIFWISDMVEKNKENELEVNTTYYLEKIIRKYIYLNRTKIKQDVKIKNKILIVLNFLIEHSSVNAYLLREDIL